MQRAQVELEETKNASAQAQRVWANVAGPAPLPGAVDLSSLRRAAGIRDVEEATAVSVSRHLDMRGLDVAQQSFPFRNAKKQEVTGVNIIARIKGENTGPAIVVSAHYDHVGVIDGEVYNGASDNASGVAGAIAIADHFIKNPPKNSKWITKP